MRQVLLILVLVGAAFGGGAVVSGPGFRWAQEHMLDYMGLRDGGEIDSLDMPPAPNGSVATSSEPLVGQAALIANRSATSPDPAEQSRPAPAPKPSPTEPFTETESAAAPATPTAPSAMLGALTSILTPDSSEPTAEPAIIPPPASTPVDVAVDPVGLPPLEAAVATPETIPPPNTAPSPAPASATTSDDWLEIRRKLAAAGVARYTIEGEPGGRVVFACLIPVAGRLAISQRIEAEGDDELQAAQAVLKRIKLWRASQAAASPS